MKQGEAKRKGRGREENAMKVHEVREGNEELVSHLD